jgi:hypothetical protein
MQEFPSVISENFNGGEVFSVEPVLLRNNELQKAINVRFKLGGGFLPRPGFAQTNWANFTSVGAGKIQGLFAGTNEMYIAVNGKIFATLTDISDAYVIHTGLSTSADVEFHEYNGDIFALNGVDLPVRIARTTIATALTAGVSASVTVAAGQGWRFGASGTITVLSSLGVDPITYTARTNDVITITAATVGFNHPIGSVAFDVRSLNVPRGAFGAEFQNTFWMAGNSGISGSTYQDNTLFYSRGATGLNPEYYYDFTGGGAGYVPVGDKGGIVGLLKTKTYLLIFKKTSIYYCSGFDADGNPQINSISETYGAASKRSFTQVGSQIFVFDGKTIKEVGEQEGLQNAIPSINAQFDDKIFKKLEELDVDQSTSVMTFNKNHKLMKLWTNEDNGGSKTCFVLDTNIAEQPWSRDLSKFACCACVFKGETFWGSETEPMIYQDEIGYDDNGAEILVEAQTADFNLGVTRLSKYFKTLFIHGLLGEAVEVTVNIYVDNDLLQSFVITDDLVTASGGQPIGRALIGSGIAAGSSAATQGYPFEIEILLKKRRNVGKISIEYTSQDVGQVYEIKGQELNGLISQKFDRKNRS